MPTTEEKAASPADPLQAEKSAAKTIAERFPGREPQLDIVGFSAPWRPFGAPERPRPADRRV